MQQLANLDCSFLAGEFDSRLAGSFFENFYDFGEGVFRIRFSKESVLVDLRGFAFLSSEFGEPPRQPSSFAMLVRKHLESSKLSAVRQPGFERIFEFEFSSKQFGKRFLVAELFGKRGNLLLLDESRRIVAPFKKVSYASRSLAPREPYVLPPSEKKNAGELEEADLNGNGQVVSFLSKQSSLAPFYLEEACARAGIALESKVEVLSSVQKKKLLEEIRGLLSAKSSPRIWLKGGKPFAFASFELKKFSGLDLEEKKFGLLSQAVGGYYASLDFESLSKQPAGEGKLEFQLKSQEEALGGFEAKAVELQNAGKWVFENNELADGLLKAAKSKDAKALNSLARKNKVSARLEKQFLEIELGY